LQNDLFKSTDSKQNGPLAYRMRPGTLDSYVGQEKVVRYVENKSNENSPHMVFFGPPGSGKTTICHILAAKLDTEVIEVNAVLSGIADLKKALNQAQQYNNHYQKRAIVFIDEIHRFNKSQQDAMLPYLERGNLILFGATTEYPKTTLNKALLSRVQIMELNKHTSLEIVKILENACRNSKQEVGFEILEYIGQFANGDARIALNYLEEYFTFYAESESGDFEEFKLKIQQNAREYDKNSNRHYDVISGFIKSIRGSDPNAAIMWLAVMLDGGETPEFIARRLIISASEDIGNANPQALTIATNAHYAVSKIGMPEARIILAQATTFLASSPKSNASYLGINAALEYVRNNPTIEVPGHIKNTGPEKSNYKYPHSFKNHFIEQTYMPNEISEKIFENSMQGYEAKFREYLSTIRS
jgi:putative ATPase